MVESAVFLPSAAVGFRLRMIFARQAARLGRSAFHFQETRPLIVPLPTLSEGFTDQGGSLTRLREDSMQHIERQLVRGQISPALELALGLRCPSPSALRTCQKIETQNPHPDVAKGATFEGAPSVRPLRLFAFLPLVFKL